MTKGLRLGQRRQLLSQFGGQFANTVKPLLEVWIGIFTCPHPGCAARGIFLNTTDDLDEVDHSLDPLRFDLDYGRALVWLRHLTHLNVRHLNGVNSNLRQREVHEREGEDEVRQLQLSYRRARLYTLDP